MFVNNSLGLVFSSTNPEGLQNVAPNFSWEEINNSTYLFYNVVSHQYFYNSVLQ